MKRSVSSHRCPLCGRLIGENSWSKPNHNYRRHVNGHLEAGSIPPKRLPISKSRDGQEQAPKGSLRRAVWGQGVTPINRIEPEN